MRKLRADQPTKYTPEERRAKYLAKSRRNNAAVREKKLQAKAEAAARSST